MIKTLAKLAHLKIYMAITPEYVTRFKMNPKILFKILSVKIMYKETLKYFSKDWEIEQRLGNKINSLWTTVRVLVFSVNYF